MHPLFSQQLAQQHMEDLRREGEIAQTADHMNTAENSKQGEDNVGFLQSLYSRTRLLYRRAATQQTTRPDEVSLEEIKPATTSIFTQKFSSLVFFAFFCHQLLKPNVSILRGITKTLGFPMPSVSP